MSSFLDFHHNFVFVFHTLADFNEVAKEALSGRIWNQKTTWMGTAHICMTHKIG
jgi:hypothetical protein